MVFAVDFDEMPISGTEDEIRKGTFECVRHDVHDIIKKDTGESAGLKLFLYGRIRETDEELEISQAIVKNVKTGEIKEAGMWVKQIANHLRIGTVVSFLQHYKLGNIGEVDGKEFKAVRNDAGYWIIKAY
jgi:hypothetical protein